METMGFLAGGSCWFWLRCRRNPWRSMRRYNGGECAARVCSPGGFCRRTVGDCPGPCRGTSRTTKKEGFAAFCAGLEEPDFGEELRYRSPDGTVLNFGWNTPFLVDGCCPDL